MTTKKFLIILAAVLIAIVVVAVVAGIIFGPEEAQEVKIGEELEPLKLL